MNINRVFLLVANITSDYNFLLSVLSNKSKLVSAKAL